MNNIAYALSTRHADDTEIQSESKLLNKNLKNLSLMISSLRQYGSQVYPNPLGFDIDTDIQTILLKYAK